MDFERTGPACFVGRSFSIGVLALALSEDIERRLIQYIASPAVKSFASSLTPAANMPFQYGIQLGLELTRLAPVVISAGSGAKSVIDFARDLRKSGSDIVVEEDLANIFGRLRIDTQLERNFRAAMSQDVNITPLHSSCELVLKSGPDRTVTRALKSTGEQPPDYRYLATVIQLSFLGWNHNRAELASALVDCIDQRFREKIPNSSPNPGFEGISQALESCNAQTSSFSWTPMTNEVRNQIRRHFSYWTGETFDGLIDLQSFHNRRVGTNTRLITALSPTLLLAAVDLLHIVQSLPEQRQMVLTSEEGAVPIIVWAHKILGLTVVIKSSTHEDLLFGTSTAPQIVIFWRSVETLMARLEVQEIRLLDETMEVRLRLKAEEHFAASIQPEPRHSLENYGTTHLRQCFNEYVMIREDHPLYLEFTEQIFAIVVLMSRKIRRESLSEETTRQNQYSLEMWRIEGTVRIVFRRFEQKIDLQRVDELQPKLKYQFSEMELPNSAEQFLTKVEKAGDDKSKAKRRLRRLMQDLSYFVFAFAHVDGLTECFEVPLKSGLMLAADNDILSQLEQSFEVVQLKPWTMFFYVARRLVGYKIKEQDEDGTFLFSDFGWSTFLNCMNIIEDHDPAAIRMQLIHLKKGIPTSGKTDEQKPRIGDGRVPDSIRPIITVCDSGRWYMPRCEIGVKDCKEMWTSRDREFLVGVRFLVPPQKDRSRPVDINSSYRRMHSILWGVCVTKLECCTHTKRPLDRARLGLNVVTVTGWEWPYEVIQERICIVLVRGDMRARWLAIQEASLASDRDTMLRAEDCCEDCALDAVSELPGKWAVII